MHVTDNQILQLAIYNCICWVAFSGEVWQVLSHLLNVTSFWSFHLLQISSNGSGSTFCSVSFENIFWKTMSTNFNRSISSIQSFSCCWLSISDISIRYQDPNCAEVSIEVCSNSWTCGPGASYLKQCFQHFLIVSTRTSSQHPVTYRTFVKMSIL